MVGRDKTNNENVRACGCSMRVEKFPFSRAFQRSYRSEDEVARFREILPTLLFTTVVFYRHTNWGTTAAQSFQVYFIHLYIHTHKTLNIHLVGCESRGTFINVPH